MKNQQRKDTASRREEQNPQPKGTPRTDRDIQRPTKERSNVESLDQDEDDESESRQY